VHDLAVGEAHDAVSGDGEGGVLGAVALERRPREVRLAAVGLDEQALLGPGEVDLLACDDVVDERARQAAGVAQPEEPDLELAARDLALSEDIDRRGEAGGPGMGGMQIERVLDRGEVEQPEDLRALDRAGEAGGREDRGAVEQRAGDRGDADGAVDGELLGRDRGAATQANAVAYHEAVAGRDRDVDLAISGAPQVPVRERARVAEGGACSVGQHGRHPPRLARDRLVTDAEHAAMHAVQQPTAHAMRDRATSEAGVEQLLPAHDAVLASRELSDEDVSPGLVELSCHQMNKSPKAEGSPPASGCGAWGGRWRWGTGRVVHACGEAFDPWTWGRPAPAANVRAHGPTNPTSKLQPMTAAATS